ncbi:SRPBCC family protein [Nocardia huaxiensis]|uniref:SRPBCC family protein n=1 Tax=Nocardia huaxiensis TaxID=2755382 RepID=A0A7D6ZM72_9NOCA|nr:SRPBCC family protein [Nocardia huaxiensis]QLY30683.1 SRPBCC family protein [Nocardia huaxiensis]UFS94174.1 SRPBCC family protein [Nocardia huaxiensis]
MPKNLEASIDIAAPPEKVWNVVSDLKRMPEFSPQCIRMQPLGSVRTGTWTINLNKDGAKVWPTTSRIVRFEPNRALAFRMTENRTIWSFTLEPTATGTKVTQRRDVVGQVPWIIRKMIDTSLGGEQNFETGLEQGMNETLGKIKRVVEA